MAKFKLTILFFLFLNLNSFYKLYAQWEQTNGPNGGYINTFIISGSNIFTGTSGGGTFLSTNNGNSWTQVNNGLTNTNVKAFSIILTIHGKKYLLELMAEEFFFQLTMGTVGLK